jgi:hypothetical protein
MVMSWCDSTSIEKEGRLLRRRARKVKKQKKDMKNKRPALSPASKSKKTGP